jgi:mono/diheme cytochrome c family protein
MYKTLLYQIRLHLVAFFLLIVENSREVMNRIAQIAPFLVVCLCLSCGSKNGNNDAEGEVDSVAIAAGSSLFTQDCSACHSFVSDGIGPQLGGITAATTPEWIRSFIKDPKGVIESGDERAVALNARFKTIMPAFPRYNEEQLDDLLAFLATRKRTSPLRQADDPNALKDPIPEKIPLCRARRWTGGRSRGCGVSARLAARRVVRVRAHRRWVRRRSSRGRPR